MPAMKTAIVSASLLIAGAIHVLPLHGALGATRLGELYGIPIADPNLTILMRHRATLFGLLGLLGLFMIAAAFRTRLQPSALFIASGSTASFLWLAWTTGDYNGQIARVVAADVGAAACLAVGATACLIDRHAAR